MNRPARLSKSKPEPVDRDNSKTMTDRDLEKRDQPKVIAGLLGQSLTRAETGRRAGLTGELVKRIDSARGLRKPAAKRERPLKQRQTKILAFIKDFTTRYPYPPALREIVEGCGLSSASVAQYNLRLLEQRGYLTRVPAAARSIALTERGRAWSPVPPGREETA